MMYMSALSHMIPGMDIDQLAVHVVLCDLLGYQPDQLGAVP